MINKIKEKISYKTKVRFRNSINDFKGLFHLNNMDKLAQIYKTDKWGKHFYTPHYQYHFQRFKYRKVRLLEIGVGGYGAPRAGGQSLRMWKRFFPFGKIFALDIHDKSFFEEKRIRIFQGSQVDKLFLEKIMNEVGEPDIIVDDGSHINEHVIETFKMLFPKLKDGGVYAIEDTQTSYWKEFGGDSTDFNNPKTLMCFFKGLTDGLNCTEFKIDNYEQTYFDKKIISIHFYHNLIFIYKGDNNEASSTSIAFSRH
jgi:hypothetical protein